MSVKHLILKVIGETSFIGTMFSRETSRLINIYATLVHASARAEMSPFNLMKCTIDHLAVTGCQDEEVR